MPQPWLWQSQWLRLDLTALLPWRQLWQMLTHLLTVLHHVPHQLRAGSPQNVPVLIWRADT